MVWISQILKVYMKEAVATRRQPYIKPSITFEFDNSFMSLCSELNFLSYDFFGFGFVVVVYMLRWTSQNLPITSITF